jgi:DNA-binding response OmpR family regulator
MGAGLVWPKCGRRARPGGAVRAADRFNDIEEFVASSNAARCSKVRTMSFDLRGAPATGQAIARDPDSRLRVAVIDRDSGFLRVLANRLDAAGLEHRMVPAPLTPERLVGMRLHALIVDLGMLGVEGWSYLERVCARLPGLPVIVCTGPSSLAQRVRGLRIGADAWITKPCHPEELIAVIQAVARRHRRSEMPVVEDAIAVGGITIRPDRHQAYAGEISLELTAREFEILHLLSQAERVLRREEIYERLWGYAMAHGDRSVDVFVGKLRQKLRAGSPEWTYIHTHFGVGYRFAAEREQDGGAERRQSTAEREQSGDAARPPWAVASGAIPSGGAAREPRLAPEPVQG